MKRVIVLIFVLGTALPLGADDRDDVRKELKALEGKWKAVALEAGGKPFPKDRIPDFTFIVAADGKSTGQTPQGEYQATITVDPKKSPRRSITCTRAARRRGKSSTASTNGRVTSGRFA